MSSGFSLLDDYGIGPGSCVSQGQPDAIGGGCDEVAPVGDRFLVKEETTATNSPSGYARKQQHLIEKSTDFFVKKMGVGNCAFATFTIEDDVDPVTGEKTTPSIKEIEKRFRSFSNGVLKRRYKDHLWVRQWGDERGRMHWHLIVAHFLGDIRTGFDFDALMEAKKHKPGTPMHRKLTRQYSRSATQALRDEWDYLRSVTHDSYGLGRRSEFVPIKSLKNIAAYVGGYLGKTFGVRPPGTKGLRLFGGTKGAISGSVRNSWGIQKIKVGNQKVDVLSPGAWLDRAKKAAIASLCKLNTLDDFTDALGRRWTYEFTKRAAETPLIDLVPGDVTYSSALAAVLDGVLDPEDVLERGIALHLPIVMQRAEPLPAVNTSPLYVHVMTTIIKRAKFNPNFVYPFRDIATQIHGQGVDLESCPF